MDRRNKLRASLGAFLRTLCDLMLLNLLWALCVLPVVTVGGFRAKDADGALYAPYAEHFEPAPIRLIPYCCFANRGECDMLVWIPVR